MKRGLETGLSVAANSGSIMDGGWGESYLDSSISLWFRMADVLETHG
ncbi:MAG: hypothetical protein JKY20_05520 [Alphaproteobacteria bacterium]|nr:hypothetical protein [Alphaproteobacteria bacterium]